VRPLPAAVHAITDGGVIARPTGTQPRTTHACCSTRSATRRLLSVRIPSTCWLPSPQGPPAVDSDRGPLRYVAWQVQLEPCLRVRARLAPGIAERLAGHRVEVRLEPCYLGEQESSSASAVP
jgi:hypothetical protein